MNTSSQSGIGANNAPSTLDAASSQNIAMATFRHASRPRESEARRLQRDLDSFTKTLSLQMRRKATLDESLREVGGNVTRKKEEMKGVLLSSREIGSLEVRLEVLSRQLVAEKAKLNQNLRENEALRDQITEFRREKASLSDFFREKQRQSLEMSQNAQSLRLQHLSFEQSESHFKLELLTMREKTSKRAFALETQTLSAQTERKSSKKAKKRLTASELWDQTVYKDSISVLKGLERDWRQRVGMVKERVESYNRTIKVLRDSLDEIRTATGQAVLKDIVTAVVKSNEQERRMVEELGKGTSEGEFLQGALQRLRMQRIASREGQRAVLDKQSTRLNSLQQELQKLRQMLTAQATKKQQLTLSLESAFPLVQHLLSLFQSYNIPPDYHFPLQPLSHTESELLPRIHALEAGICYLLTYVSAGLPVLNGSDISPKAFNSTIKIAPPLRNSERRVSEDSEEMPLTETEFRTRAARRVPIPKLW